MSEAEIINLPHEIAKELREAQYFLVLYATRSSSTEGFDRLIQYAAHRVELVRLIAAEVSRADTAEAELARLRDAMLVFIQRSS